VFIQLFPSFPRVTVRPAVVFLLPLSGAFLCWRETWPSSACLPALYHNYPTIFRLPRQTEGSEDGLIGAPPRPCFTANDILAFGVIINTSVLLSCLLPMALPGSVPRVFPVRTELGTCRVNHTRVLQYFPAQLFKAVFPAFSNRTVSSDRSQNGGVVRLVWCPRSSCVFVSTCKTTVKPELVAEAARMQFGREIIMAAVSLPRTFFLWADFPPHMSASGCDASCRLGVLFSSYGSTYLPNATVSTPFASL